MIFVPPINSIRATNVWTPDWVNHLRTEPNNLISAYKSLKANSDWEFRGASKTIDAQEKKIANLSSHSNIELSQRSQKPYHSLSVSHWDESEFVRIVFLEDIFHRMRLIGNCIFHGMLADGGQGSASNVREIKFWSRSVPFFYLLLCIQVKIAVAKFQRTKLKLISS